VETPEQLHHLLALDCRLGQGRLFGSADVPEEIGRRLEARDGLPANVLPVSFRGRTSVQGHDLEPSHAVRAAAEPTG
jgi:EAL domain-containing protein (putative c-di-GMP-specific phosphodiesterase class I)